MASTIFVRVSIPWLSPTEAEIPPEWRGRWPAKWCGVRWPEGRVIGLPSWSWRWLRRTQGDYLERCFVRDTFRGRTYLRGVACPVGLEPVPVRASPTKRTVYDVGPSAPIVRRCGCGRKQPGA